MPKRTDLHKILIIGSGPIVIGQACEFDYSGTQACKALREEGYEVVLVNSNPATIMTDPEMADRTYVEPITAEVVAKIIAKERPDALLPTLGGQTGLNTAIERGREGRPGGIRRRADRRQRGGHQARPRSATCSRRPWRRPGWSASRAGTSHSLEEARAVAEEIGFPVIIRPSFTLGGTGGGTRGRHGRTDAHRRRRPQGQPDHRGPGRGIGPRLEGIRARGHARPQRQRGHHLLDREPRPHGRAHRRQHHRGPGPDADRPRNTR